jgi:hypothetical protein
MTHIAELRFGLLHQMLILAPVSIMTEKAIADRHRAMNNPR